jgi:ribosomal protein L16/L10AE
MAKQNLIFTPTFKNKIKFKKFFLPSSNGVIYSKFNLNEFEPHNFKLIKYVTKRSHLNKFRRSLFSTPRHLFKVSLRATSYFFIKFSTILVIKRLIAPFFRSSKFKKINIFKFNMFLTFNFTKKPLAVRIGGGVGKKIRFSGFFVKPGSEIFSAFTSKPTAIKSRLLKLRKKFSKSVVVSVS